MFGVGPQEMAVIALIALIIFGPGKLPEVMREAGKHYRKFKGMADEMTGELNKVTAEARKELDGALGDMGPMGKDIEESFGLKGKSTKRTTASTGNTTTSGSKKSTTSSGKRTTTSRAAGNKKATTDSRSTTASKTTTAKAAPKPLVATKEDPLADLASFETEKMERPRRSRSATPSAITDLTPRDVFGDDNPEVAEKTPVSVDLSEIEDPIARARARRRAAGYARA